MTQPLNAAFDGRPEDYDQLRQCWLNQRRLLYIRRSLDALPLLPGDAVIEIGSGTGWLLQQLGLAFPDCRFTGVEPDASYVRFAAARAVSGNVRFVQGTAERIPPLETPPCVVLSNDVLHHVVSIEEAVGSITAAVAPDAHWLAIEPNRLNPYTGLRQALKHGERNFHPPELLTPAHSAGWSLLRRDFLFLVPPFLRTVPAWVAALEETFEKIPVLAGGIAIELQSSAREYPPRSQRPCVCHC